jgi:hypothetical protein
MSSSARGHQPRLDPDQAVGLTHGTGLIPRKKPRIGKAGL